MIMLRICRTPAQLANGAEALSLPAALPAAREIAGKWGCELVPTGEMLVPPFGGKEGWLLLPDIMHRLQGILLACRQGPAGVPELLVAREEEATTWEDFLLMKLAHTLAYRLKGQLFFGEEMGEETEPLPVEPERFATFEAYVDRVLEAEDDLVKEIKKAWIYAHRKRAIR
ncbi:hypothetical protein [Paenibacillus sp. YN15]|uniref:hypothetical protein n=1 Tax=Paenibacillus sp. YN15 TaxID=1742774 RepID=UPI000DCB30B6|nr:hypothetical protein [Paenibacillus sp. YN15]RAU92265.1 hypothetical protein DQG13_27900 [Paenibacillus sp. YN15]